MNSSDNQSAHFLGAHIPPIRIERLLVEWANVPDDFEDRDNPNMDAAISRLIRRYPMVFGEDDEALISETKPLLRKAWESPDLDDRAWYIFKIRDGYNTHRRREPQAFIVKKGHELPTVMYEGGLTPREIEIARNAPPPLTPFERVMRHFHRAADRARRCGNSDCPAPYFLTNKRGQKYCSEKCSGPAQREQKRRWWADNRGKTK